METTNRQKFDASKYLEYALKHWKWYVVGIALSVFAGVSYLRYATREYVSSTTVLIRSNEDNNLLIREIRGNLDMLSKQRLSEAEATILQSRYLMDKVVKKLNINVNITSLSGRTGLRRVEAYTNAPFDVTHPDGGDSLYYDQSVQFTVEPLDAAHFELKFSGSAPQKVAINKAFSVKGLDFQLTVKEDYLSHWESYKYQVNISPVRNVVSGILKNLAVDMEKADAGIIKISMKGLNPEKNTDILRQLILEHEEATIAERSRIAENTGEFVDERIALVESELSLIERSGESLKSENRVINLDIEYSHLLLRLHDIEKDIVNTGVQANLVDYVSEYMHEEKDALIPANIGLASTPLFKSITHYNELYNEYQRLATSTGIENPSTKKVKEELDITRSNVLQGMKSLKFSNQERLIKLEAEERKIHEKLGTLPSYETNVRGNNRLKELKEATYVFLLQKKEENEIDLASTSGNLRVIDAPYGESSPISPNKRIVYVLIPIFGILIPSLILFIFSALNRYVTGASDFREIGLDIFGSIPKKDRKTGRGYERNERTEISEAFRIIRFNLTHLFADHDGSKVLVVTSTRPNEGKTFVALNIARCLADIDKKVAVVGFDLRNPQLLEEIDKTSLRTGISNFIEDPNLTVNDLLIPSPTYAHLSFVPSGPLKDNPSELLAKPRMDELMEQLREQFEYVIIDSCSIDPMIDTFLLLKHSDQMLYISRVKHLLKRDLSILKNLKADPRVDKFKLILNAVEPKKLTYEYAGKTRSKSLLIKFLEAIKLRRS